MQRAIIHLDMDAFYASVEQRDRPEWRRKPLIVGGHPTRGVVLAASYEARPFGIRSAMPMHRALRLAPRDLVVAPPRFQAYAEASEAVFAILEGVTPLVEPLSLDEAFLDVTASTGLFGAPPDIARALRARIRAELDLTASAGIAESKYIAKVASDGAKPDGQLEVPWGQARAFLAPLPVSRLWGVGPRTAERLHSLGLCCIGDVAARDAAWMRSVLGPQGAHLWEFAQGRDERPVVPDREAKSIGAQDTFTEDTDDAEAIAVQVHAQAFRVGRRLRRAGVKARAVQLTVKYADFTVATRRRTLREPTDDGQTLYREAVALLPEGADIQRRVRLTGVTADELVRPGAGQLSLFDGAGVDALARAERLNAAMDRIASRFGGAAVLPADLVAHAQATGGSTLRSEADERARRALGAPSAQVSAARR